MRIYRDHYLVVCCSTDVSARNLLLLSVVFFWCSRRNQCSFLVHWSFIVRVALLFFCIQYIQLRLSFSRLFFGVLWSFSVCWSQHFVLISLSSCKYLACFIRIFILLSFSYVCRYLILTLCLFYCSVFISSASFRFALFCFTSLHFASVRLVPIDYRKSRNNVLCFEI